MQAGGLLLKQPKQKAAAVVAQPPTPAAAAGADSAADAVMLKPQLASEVASIHSRKRQAEASGAEAELAQQPVGAQQGAIALERQEPEGNDLVTLEQRVNALQIHQQPTAQGKLHQGVQLCCAVQPLYHASFQVKCT